MSKENSDSDEDWVRIGNLKGIYIYPLDTGYGFKISEAFCTRDGLQSCSLREEDVADGHVKRYIDRAFVPIKQFEGELLNNSLLADLDSVALVNKLQENANKMIFGTWRSEFTYLGEKMIASDTGIDITHSHSGKVGEIGFIPQEERNKFISQARSKFEVDDFRKFLSNFYAYTMINITSLNALQEKNKDCENISIQEFRPHFVIETKEENLLDRIVELKIGEKVRFSNIVPCTHRFEGHDHGKNTTKQKDLYDILKTNRSLNALYPELYKSKMPAFGINLDIVIPGKISMNDDIWVKFKKHKVKKSDCSIDVKETKSSIEVKETKSSVE